MKKILITFLITLLVLAMAYPHNMPNPKLKKGGYNGSSIKLPNGFSVKIIATDLGATRHIAVAKNGDIYAKLSKLKDGKGIYLFIYCEIPTKTVLLTRLNCLEIIQEQAFLLTTTTCTLLQIQVFIVTK